MNRDQLKHLEKQLWSAADKLRANSGLKANQYATPILGLIFLRFADNIYRGHEPEIRAEFDRLSGTRREKPIAEIAVARCGFYLPDNARYDYLLSLPEEADIAAKIKQAMVAIETHKPELEDTLPRDDYFDLMPDGSSSLLKSLLKTFADIPADAEGDVFGQIYEYFLGNFALAEGQGGGEFFTPKSVVRFIIEIIKPTAAGCSIRRAAAAACSSNRDNSSVDTVPTPGTTPTSTFTAKRKPARPSTWPR